MPDWMEGLNVAITVADKDYMIAYMNPKAMATFQSYGGSALLNKNLMECHNERSKELMKKIMETGHPHTYTIEKGGKKKIIHQARWEKDGQIGGLVEISIEIPLEVEHFKRD